MSRPGQCRDRQQYSMFELMKAFAGIALRRIGPEDLPKSTFLLGVTVALYATLQVPAAILVFGARPDALRTVVLDIALLSVALWMLLYLTGFRARYQQTLTAILGTSALLSLISLPFNLWRNALGDNAAAATAPSAFILAIVLWSFIVDGHILSRALSRAFFLGVMIAITYFFVHISLLFEFVPVPN